MLFSLFQPKNYGAKDLERDIRWSFGGGPTNSGVTVSADTAMRVSAVFACTRVLAEDVAKLPLLIYRRKDKGRERATNHNLYDLLHNQPNEFQTSSEWREMMQGHAALRGNAYSYISRAGGRVLELLPIHPDRCAPKLDKEFQLTYELTFETGERRIVPKDEIFHLKGLSSNGYEGISVVGMARESIGLAAATEKFGGQLFKNGAKPGGVLKHPGRFSSKDVADRVRESWQSYVGGENAHGTALLEEGMDWVQVGMTSEDSQFLETRKFQMVDICRFFRVSPYKIYADIEKAKGWSTLEQQNRDDLNNSLLPWLVKWEQSINTRLMSRPERQSYYAEFLLDGLLRADTKSRNESYQIQRRNGIISANEWREKENMNPRPDAAGDEYIYEANMTTGATDEPKQD